MLVSTNRRIRALARRVDEVTVAAVRQILLTDPAGNLIELFQPAQRPSAPTLATP
jgi:hypothetical protein